MKPINMKTLALLSLLTQLGTLPVVQLSQADALPQPNAFTEGTIHVKMTQSQIDQLLAYVNQSQVRLEQAMTDAANRSESEQARIYLDAVKSVVLVSYHAHPGTELLMRVILNQALALTYGNPKADGNGFEKEGVLARSGYQAILPAILKDSITLALKYVDQDRHAVKTDQLFDLPYAEMAYQRLLLSQEWMRSILEQDLAAAFGIESLEQWLSSMVSQDQQHQAKFAGEITFVTQALSQLSEMSGSAPVFAGKRERFARLTLRKLAEKMARNMGSSPVTSGAASSVPSESLSLSDLLGSFVKIPHGTFQMGSPSTEAGRYNDEEAHTVTLTKDFEMQVTTVTQLQWFKVMGTTPSKFKAQANCPSNYMAHGTLPGQTEGICPNLPVEGVSIDEVHDFINTLNQKAQKSNGGYIYRLPTEAEWEYAARAGTRTAYFFGNDETRLGQFAWFYGNSGGQPHDVADPSHPLNGFGLADMHGNVWQWIENWYQSYGSDKSVTDPLGPVDGECRVVRGGVWSDGGNRMRSAFRGYNCPRDSHMGVGFRLVRTPVTSEDLKARAAYTAARKTALANCAQARATVKLYGAQETEAARTVEEACAEVNATPVEP